MSLIHYNPWPMIDTLRRDFEQAYAAHRGESQTWQPQVDVLEFKDRYELHADLPGVAPEQVDLDLTDGVLTLSGQRERRVDAEGDAPERVRQELLTGRFERRFQLPRTVDAGAVSARAANGVLRITIPKQAEAQPLKIKVS